jgi:hypothetical protein
VISEQVLDTTVTHQFVDGDGSCTTSSLGDPRTERRSSCTRVRESRWAWHQGSVQLRAVSDIQQAVAFSRATSACRWCNADPTPTSPAAAASTAAGCEFTRYDAFKADTEGIGPRAGGGRIAWSGTLDGNTLAIKAET